MAVKTIPARRQVRSAALRKRLWTNWIPTGLVWVATLITAIPVFWMLTTAFKSPSEALQYPPTIFPHPIVWTNFGDVINQVPWLTYMRNSMTVSVLVMLGTVLSASLAAYALARLRAPGRNLVFLMTLATLMLPTQVTLIPLFLIFRQVSWIDTLLPLIVPSFFGGGAFYIFLLRQFFLGISPELFDAAKVDGCGYFKVWYRILLPMSKPVLTTVMLFAFLAGWNDFLGPLIFLNSDSNFTVALGLQRFISQVSVHDLEIPWHLLMAAALMAVAPCIILFAIFQRYLVQGIVVTGVKG